MRAGRALSPSAWAATASGGLGLGTLDELDSSARRCPLWKGDFKGPQPHVTGAKEQLWDQKTTPAASQGIRWPPSLSLLFCTVGLTVRDHQRMGAALRMSARCCSLPLPSRTALRASELAYPGSQAEEL